MSRSRIALLGVVAGAALIPAGTAEAARPMSPFGERHLWQGMRGHDVRVLQDFLTRVGITTPVDGRYGPYTARRVRSWERRVGRRADGRMVRRDARLLRKQVESGTRVIKQEKAAAAPAAEKATLGSDGRAIAPATAPAEVKAVIEAGNRIVGKPYKYGGGHGRWEDSGYDCSGSMSYALRGGGFVKTPMTSGDFARWARAGKGTWITTYGNSGHSYMVVAGLRFDTGWHGGDGPAWSTTMRPGDGYAARHPAGF